jgi:hypothetical protein
MFIICDRWLLIAHSSGRETFRRTNQGIDSVHANYETTAPILIAILLGYIVLCLLLGAKKVYFQPWQSNSSEDPEEKPLTDSSKAAQLKQGAAPWKVGEASPESSDSSSSSNADAKPGQS